jgi:hypothetical protein
MGMGQCPLADPAVLSADRLVRPRLSPHFALTTRVLPTPDHPGSPDTLCAAPASQPASQAHGS